MAMDYAKIIPFVMETLPKLGLSFKNLTDVVKFYEKHKDFIKALLSLFKGKPETGTVTQPGPVPPTAPVPVPVPVPVVTPSGDPLIAKILGKILFVEESRGGGSGGKIVPLARFLEIVGEGGQDAQRMDERVHFDFTPLDSEGNEIPREIVRKLRRPNGAPCLDLRWTRAEKLNWNSNDEADHFGLESYNDADVGFTPVLVLNTPESGRFKCELWAFIPAEYNGGLEVVSNKIVWYCD